MRVITGSARGRRLISPEGYDVRPTTDKVKESIFNIIQFDLPGACVLDLFAGSGQLGIEALSRGAEKAVFIDNSRKSLEVIKSNIELCRFSSMSQVLFSDSLVFIKNTDLKFDIVFLDPPYKKELCNKALPDISRCLNPGAIIICETQNDEILPSDDIGDIYFDKEYCYSAIKLTVFRKRTTDGE